MEHPVSAIGTESEAVWTGWEGTWDNVRDQPGVFGVGEHPEV